MLGPKSIDLEMIDSFPSRQKKKGNNNIKSSRQKKSQFLVQSMAQFLRSPRAIRNFPVQVATKLHRALGQVALRLLVRRDEELVDERVRQPSRHGRFRRVLCETRFRLL